jgi:outer membrane protein OmpA-like peptidoglycan-associated protein
MQENPSMKIRIESHTDSWGDNDYNLYLSDKRAKSTKAYMVAQGIEPERIVEAQGFGEEQLLNDCTDGSSCSREMHRLNRRSEFIIVDM